MVDLRYRIFLVSHLAELFAVPAACVFGGLRALEAAGHGARVGMGARVALYILSPVVFGAVRLNFNRWWNERKARRAGVPMPKLIVGKKMGNVDILKRFVAGMREDYVGEVFDELLDEAGVDTARLSLLWSPDKVISRDHDVLKFVYSTGFPHFAKGDLARLRGWRFWGTGIFGSDGETWKFHRGLARPYFSRERINDYHAFNKYTDRMITIAKDVANTNAPVDVQDLFSRFTLDTAGEFLFGTSDFNTLGLPLPQSGKSQMGPKGSAMEGAFGTFALAFEEGQLEVVRRAIVTDMVWTMEQLFSDQLVAPQATMDAYLMPLAKKAVDDNKARKEGKESHMQSFLEHLAGSTDDIQVVRDQLLNILLAARDTTAALLSFTCYLLAKHPEVMARLREEILSRIGPNNAPTYDDLREFKYLRAVLNESLRVFPPVPINVRTSQSECIIPTRSGHLYIPGKGFQFLMSVISIHKRKDLWGPDADVFDPDRWLDPDRSKNFVADPFRFLPFHAGPRMCIGQQFAYNEASFVIVRLLQTFDSFSVAMEEAAPKEALPPANWKTMGGRRAVEDCIPQSALTMYARGGMWLRMHVANH